MNCDVPIDRDITRLQDTMQAVQALLRRLADHHEPQLANALLNVAVARMIEADGARCTAQVLHRLAETVRTQPTPSPERAVDLCSFNA